MKMAIEFLISKKGTKVVKARQVYEHLELAGVSFSKLIVSWLSDVYDFKDGIRKPEVNRDYGIRKNGNADYYLTLEFAYKAVLRTGAKNKLKLARMLNGREFDSLVFAVDINRTDLRTSH
jgi:hypothetical protein